MAGELQENITRLELDNGISAGIHWRALGADMVPIYEEHSARMERNIDINQWYAMEPMDRAMIVAVRRIDVASKNHQTEAEIRAAKKKLHQKY